MRSSPSACIAATAAVNGVVNRDPRSDRMDAVENGLLAHRDGARGAGIDRHVDLPFRQ